MKIAIIADIHGDSIALDAVFQDANSVEPDLYIFLGDYVAIGYNPSEVLNRINRIDNAIFVRGNTDRYVVTGEGPPPTIEDATKNPSLISKLNECTASFSWTRGFVSATGWFDWLAKLPVEHQTMLPNGSNVLSVHASPGRDDGPGIGPYTTDFELKELLRDCKADIVCVGHCHAPFVRRMDSILVVNPGSVGNPLAPDLRASYAVLEVSNLGCSVTHRRVEYEHKAVIDAVRQISHPSAEFIISHQLGQKSIDSAIKASGARK